MAAEIANAPNEGPRRADRRLCGRADHCDGANPLALSSRSRSERLPNVLPTRRVGRYVVDGPPGGADAPKFANPKRSRCGR